jgi:hypothetical protein
LALAVLLDIRSGTFTWPKGRRPLKGVVVKTVNHDPYPTKLIDNPSVI